MVVFHDDLHPMESQSITNHQQPEGQETWAHDIMDNIFRGQTLDDCKQDLFNKRKVLRTKNTASLRFAC